MLQAGLDLSRRKLDVCLLSDRGEPAGPIRISETYCQQIRHVLRGLGGAAAHCAHT
jgi:hypothetical protein